MRTADTTWLDLGHWLPTRFQHSEDRWELVQARVLTLLLLIYLASCIPAFVFSSIGVLYHTVDSTIPAVITAFGSAAALACLRHFQRSANLGTASHFYAWIALATTLAAIAYSGGWQSPVCVYLLTLPISAGFAMSQRGRLWYTAAVGLLYSALFLLHRNGFGFTQLVSSAYHTEAQALVYALSLLSVSGCLALFDVTQDRLSAALARDKTELQHRASEDLLTGALNEQALLEHMEKHARAAAAQRSDDSVMHIAVRNYDDILQCFGADRADAFIAATAQRLQTLLGYDAKLGRYAANEFVVHAPCSMTEWEFTRLREKLHALHGKSVTPADGSRFLLDLRIGVCSHPHAALSPREMMDRARATIAESAAIAGSVAHEV